MISHCIFVIRLRILHSDSTLTAPFRVALDYFTMKNERTVVYPAGKTVLKVSKITLEQRPNGLCYSVISLALNRFLPG